MTISLREVATANFRTVEAADAVNGRLMERLGSRARYLPARLAIGRSLGLSAAPPVVAGEPGRTIKGETLFGSGTDLAAWVALIVERDGRADLGLRDLQALVAAHWARGLDLLDGDWREAGESRDRLLRALAERAGLSGQGATGDDSTDGAGEGGSAGAVGIPVGEVGTDERGDAVAWSPSAPGGSPHLAVMGGVGSGKTRTVVAMLKALRRASAVPMLAFDFKGDLGSSGPHPYRLDEAFAARVLSPPREPIPLDVLHLASADPYDVKTAADRFRESFARLKGARVGDRQRAALAAAAERALTRARPTRLPDVRDALQAEYQRQTMKHDGAVALLNDLCRFPLFEPLMDPDAFFRRSWIVSLPADATEATRGMVVNLLLDALDRWLLSQPDAPMDASGNRALRHVLLLDEAHKVLGSRLPSLSSLIRQSRSKGGLVALVSQSPDDFSGEEDDFLSEMGMVLAFSTNASPTNVRRVLGSNLDLPGLPKGACWMRRRGDPAAIQVQAFA